MPQPSNNLEYLFGPGVMRSLMRSQDWSASVLGHPSSWQPELTFLVRLMLDTSFPAFIAWGDELGFLYNDAYARILGEKHPAALGKHFEDIWYEIWSDIQPIINKALQGQSLYFEDLPLTVLRKGYPEQAWFTFSYSPVYLSDGKVGGMHCTVIESTDKVLAMKRQAFRFELTERLRPLSSSEEIIDAATALLGQYLEMDRAWYAEIDDQARRFMTRNVWTSHALPPIPLEGSIDDYGSVLVDTLRRGAAFAVADIARDPYLGAYADQYHALEIGSILIVPLIKKGKLVTNLNLSKTSLHYWSEHEIELAVHVAEYAWAMIERARAEQAKRESELRYGTLISIVDEGFAIIELLNDETGRPNDYRFLEVNPAFEKQSGMTNVIGKTIRELVPHIEPYWIDIFGRVALSGIPERVEHQARSTGSWYSLYASRLDASKNTRIALLFSNITSQKRTEEELRQSAAELSEANRRKTEFLATLAHELRNPLAPLRTGLEVMRLPSSNPNAVAQVRDMMGRQIMHMVRLIDDLLDIARISSGKVVLQKQMTDLGAIIAHSVETSLPLIEANHHNLKVSLPPDPIIVEIDPVRMEQAIGNLLTNAAKYTPEGGHIDLTVTKFEQEIVISVRDDGIGIPPQALPFVFDMFAQVGKSLDRSRGGLGIGLAIVSRLVKMHEGSVSVASQGIDKGSTFTLRLPIVLSSSEAFLEAGPSIAEEISPSKSPLHILLADDNVDAAEMLAHVLRYEGHHVQVAHDGPTAIRIAEASPPQVAILDIGMPGMTGYDVARTLRGKPGMKDATLVALTGWGAAEDKARTLEAGFDFHLTKPVEHTALARILKKHTDS